MNYDHNLKTFNNIFFPYYYAPSCSQKHCFFIHKFSLTQSMHILDLLLANTTLYLNYFGNVKVYNEFTDTISYYHNYLNYFDTFWNF